jgi:hypothetical protein
LELVPVLVYSRFEKPVGLVVVVMKFDLIIELIQPLDLILGLHLHFVMG